jgi:hypothetical protein
LAADLAAGVVASAAVAEEVSQGSLPRVFLDCTIYRTAVKRSSTDFRKFFQISKKEGKMAEQTLEKHGGENWQEQRAGIVASERAAQARQWALVTGAARLCDLTEGALRKAIARGDLAAYDAADGTRLVYVPDVLEWAGRAGDPRSFAERKATIAAPRSS